LLGAPRTGSGSVALCRTEAGRWALTILALLTLALLTLAAVGTALALGVIEALDLGERHPFRPAFALAFPFNAMFTMTLGLGMSSSPSSAGDWTARSTGSRTGAPTPLTICAARWSAWPVTSGAPRSSSISPRACATACSSFPSRRSPTCSPATARPMR
jgi:hypothetical protein